MEWRQGRLVRLSGSDWLDQAFETKRLVVESNCSLAGKCTVTVRGVLVGLAAFPGSDVSRLRRWCKTAAEKALTSMSRRLTIYEVADAAGVSIASVSRVMHGRGGVSEQTRERVERVIERSGYVVNGAARGLAQRRLGVLGFVFCDLDGDEPSTAAVTSLYSHEVVRGAERAARRVGDAVLLAATHSGSGRRRVLSLAAKVDGLAVMAGSLPTADLRRLAARVPGRQLRGGATAGRARLRAR